ncbi:MAG: sialidase family protein [Candidatus Dormibacteria bacterium]
MKSRGLRLAFAAICLLLSGSFVTAAPVVTAIGPVSFTPRTYVDSVRAGGEPESIRSTKFGNLVYSSHEGTTHLDRSGATGVLSTAGFFCPGALQPTVQQSCYSNHVWIWTSDDKGKTWTFRDEGAQYSGFSDPDLTEDAAGSIYNTGINLVNVAIFSSQDGGKTWPHGTVQCAGGDRPWLAGGKAGELFTSIDTNLDGHQLFYSNNSGDSCVSNAAVTDTGIADHGTWPAGCVNTNSNPFGASTCGSFSGFGKGVYDPVDGSFIEPAQFLHADGTYEGVGISRLPKAADAFNGGGEVFKPEEVVTPTTLFSPIGAPEVLQMDREENLYFAWDTNERDPNGTNGCSLSLPNAAGGPTPRANHIKLEVGKHVGPGRWQWLPPMDVESYGPARIAGAHVEWPWSVVGDPGNVSVVWYQMDQLVDPDCDIAAATGQPAPGVKTYIYEAHVTNALDPTTRQVAVTNASGGEIHQGGICDSGTTCVATGQDRRLGDYFTNSIDERGCVLVASGDTTVPDAVSGGDRITSLPIFIRQAGGPSLTGQDCGAVSASSSGPSIAPASSGGAGTPTTGTGSTGAGLLAVALAGLAVAVLMLTVASTRRPA